MILRSPGEHKNRDHRHAGMDGRHPVRKDASGDIHVNLDSSTPCWNDAIEGVLLKLTEARPPPYFQRRLEGREASGVDAFGCLNFVLFAIFVVKYLFLFGCGVAALGSS